jgi:hypothetical protein
MKLARPACAILAATILAAALVLSWSSVARALELSIIESGPSPNPEIGLWARDLTDGFGGVTRLVSPSGQVFTPESILERNRTRALLQRFNSLADAMDYVEGTWNATPFASFPFPSPSFEPFDFDIDSIPLETINRTPPTLLSPTPGATIKNGATFLFAWDYETSDPPPNRTSITRIPQFDPLSSWGRSVVSTPRPGNTTRLSGGTGSGERSFSHTLTNVPGADENRFLATFTASEAALPLDVELTLGSYYANNTSFPPPRVRFYYSRELDPFYITLSTVPEPSSIGLVTATAIVGIVRRARRP